MSSEPKRLCSSTPEMSTLFHPCDEELLLRITTCLAQNGYYKEVGVMVQLSKAFWNDEQIWDAIKDVPGRHGYTHLMYAAKKGDLGRTIFLLARGANAAGAPAGETPLHLAILPRPACTQTDLDLVRLLVKHGADVNALDWLGCSPLFLAANPLSHPRNLPMVKLLVEMGADLELGTTHGDAGIYPWTPFTNAVILNRWELAKELKGMGADVNAFIGNKGMRHNSLTCAVQDGQAKKVHELLDLGANVNHGIMMDILPVHLVFSNIKDVPGTTPATSPYLGIFKELLARGAYTGVSTGLLGGESLEDMVEGLQGGEDYPHFKAALDAHFLLHPPPVA